jgi:AraC-like DNA-binding protein
MRFFEYTIYSAFLIAFLAIIMLLYNLKSNKATVYLFTFLILHAIYGITQTVLVFGDPANNVTVFFMTLLLNNAAPLWWLRGPSLYFYVRSVLNDQPKLKKSDILHFLPFAINLIAIVPYLFTSWNYKTDIARNSIGDIHYVVNCNYDLFYPHMINNYLRPIQFLLYIVASCCMLIRFYPNLKAIPGKIRPKQYQTVFYWLCGLLVLLLSNTLLINYITFGYFTSSFTNHLSPDILRIYSTTNILFAALPMLILFFPYITYGMPKRLGNTATSCLKSMRIKAETDKKTEHSPVRNASFDEDSLNKLSIEIVGYLKKNKPFLEPDFSLYDLSKGMNTPQHQLRYCLSHILKTSFTNLKNDMRVHHAIDLLGTDTIEKISIDGIGRQSGFKSPSNFYACFKETTSYTPSEWLKNKNECLKKEYGVTDVFSGSI